MAHRDATREAIALRDAASTGALRAVYQKLVLQWGGVSVDDLRLAVPEVHDLKRIGMASSGDMARLRKVLDAFDGRSMRRK